MLVSGSVPKLVDFWQGEVRHKFYTQKEDPDIYVILDTWFMVSFFAKPSSGKRFGSSISPYPRPSVARALLSR